MEKNAQRKRILWLDYARCFAIICVVFIHSVERIYNAYDMQETAQMAAGSLLFRDAAFAIGRLGVPVFLAISGYLLLDPFDLLSHSPTPIVFFSLSLFFLILTAIAP